jgi:CelD/BcsL family acetyltransferase involved in cellulose biosynthesis
MRGKKSKSMTGRYSVQWLSGANALGVGEIRDTWSTLLRSTKNPRAILQSPAWANYRAHFAGTELMVGVIRTDNAIIGIVPLLTNAYSFRLMNELNIEMPGAVIMGNEPLGAFTAEAYCTIFDALATTSELKAIHLPGVLSTAEFAHFLQGPAVRQNHTWFVYSPPPEYVYYYIDMPKTAQDYFEGTLTTKRRNERQRSSKKLAEMGSGRVGIERIDREEMVGEFLRAASSIAARSWQRTLLGCEVGSNVPRFDVLTQFAREGCLRSYLLKCGGEPAAYCIGFQSNEVFYYYEIAHDPKWAPGSPGALLLYMLLEDLFAERPPKVVYFGPGTSEYKRWFSNAQGTERNVHIMRKTYLNRGAVAVHRAIASAKSLRETLRQRSAAPA